MAKQDNDNKNLDAAAYEQEIERLRAQLAEKEESERTLLSSNEELQRQLQSSEEEVAKDKIFVTHEKKKYQVMAGSFYADGERIEAKDLQKNPDLIKNLIDRKSGILREV